SADLFVGALEHAGPELTVDSFLDSLNDGTFTHTADGAQAAPNWPVNHLTSPPCTALVELTDDGYQQTLELSCANLVKP
nr:hypothetical protein [Micromonospora sp. DSM 115978]